MQIYYDPANNDFVTTPGIIYGTIAPDGTTGSLTIGFVGGNRTVSFHGGRITTHRVPPADPRLVPAFGFTPELANAGYPGPGIILGFKGSVDDGGIIQLGAIIEARSLSLKQSPTTYHLQTAYALAQGESAELVVPTADFQKTLSVFSTCLLELPRGSSFRSGNDQSLTNRPRTRSGGSN